MSLLIEFRAGVKVLARHLRNSGRDPRRLAWVLGRTLRVIFTGRAGAIVQRHLVVDHLHAQYPDWIRRYDTLDDASRNQLGLSLARMRLRPRISVIVPCYKPRIALLDAAIKSIRNQLYDNWQLCIADDASGQPEVRRFLNDWSSRDARIKVTYRGLNGGIAACTNTAIEFAGGDFVAFLDQDDLLAETALSRMVESLNLYPDAKVFYSDEDKLDVDGRRHSPHFKPDWNPEWMKTSNYVLHLTMIETKTLRDIGGFALGIDGVQDWDVLLRATEHVGDGAVAHVPFPLYHWREGENSTASGIYLKSGLYDAQQRVIENMLVRRNVAASPERTLNGWRLRYRIPEPKPLVSIVIPTRNLGWMLKRCLDSIRERSTYPNFEIVIVDHESTESLARSIIDALASDGLATVVPFHGAFNYAAECNLGVRHAKGAFIVLLNNDVEVITPGWIEEIVGHACQPDTGLVGATLLYPNDTIQHAGVILGANGSADRPYIGYRRGYAGIAGRAQSAQNVTALITACAAISRERYERAGGMDETLAISHNDLDLCLRVQALGYRNVWTPHAELYHHESMSRGYDNSPAQAETAKEEAARFRARWGAKAYEDPCYNINLTLNGQLFSLASPPRPQLSAFQR